MLKLKTMQNCKADVTLSDFLIYMQETCIQVACTAIHVLHKRNMADDEDDDLAVDATIILAAKTTRTSNQ